jgi:hypothetical protein
MKISEIFSRGYGRGGCGDGYEGHRSYGGYGYESHNRYGGYGYGRHYGYDNDGILGIHIRL